MLCAQGITHVTVPFRRLGRRIRYRNSALVCVGALIRKSIHRVWRPPLAHPPKPAKRFRQGCLPARRLLDQQIQPPAVYSTNSSTAGQDV